MGKVKWGGVKLGEGKVYTLAYTDDIVFLLAEEEDEIRSMMGRLEGYLDKKVRACVRACVYVAAMGGENSCTHGPHARLIMYAMHCR